MKNISVALISLKRKNKIIEYPSLSLGYLASYIRKHIPNIKIKIIEGGWISKEKLLEEIKNSDIIGISSLTWEFRKAIELAKYIKKRTNKPLILGGVHITIEKKLPLCFDIGVIGEGEITFLELLKFYQKYKTFSRKEIKRIKGIIYNSKDKTITTESRELIEDLDEIPFPAWDLVDMSGYYLKDRVHYRNGKGRGIHLFTSRGCPYNCVYCDSPVLWKRRIRYHSAKYVINEIKHLINKYNVEIIDIYDDLFTGNKQRLKEIVESIEKEGINKKVKFTCLTRANIFDEDICKLLKRMNMVHIGFGLENGSERILKYLKSNTVTVEDNKKAVELTKKYGFEVASNFMIGNPGETEEDLQETYDFIKNYPLHTTRIYVTTPLIGTELRDYAIKKKIITADYPERFIFYYDSSYPLLSDMKRKTFEKWFLKLLVRANISMFKRSKSSIFRNIGYNLFVNPNLIKNKRLILPYIGNWIKELFL